MKENKGFLKPIMSGIKNWKGIELIECVHIPNTKILSMVESEFGMKWDILLHNAKVG
jgi:hypothetical protein